jgi:hypothetical protein
VVPCFCSFSHFPSFFFLTMKKRAAKRIGLDALNYDEIQAGTDLMLL